MDRKNTLPFASIKLFSFKTLTTEWWFYLLYSYGLQAGFSLCLRVVFDMAFS